MLQVLKSTSYSKSAKKMTWMGQNKPSVVSACSVVECTQGEWCTTSGPGFDHWCTQSLDFHQLQKACGEGGAVPEYLLLQNNCASTTRPRVLDDLIIKVCVRSPSTTPDHYA